MLPANTARLKLGMLLLFRMRRGAIAQHCGIVTEVTQDCVHFIHAYERLGVIEVLLTPAWRRRVVFAFLYPQIKGESRATAAVEMFRS